MRFTPKIVQTLEIQRRSAMRVVEVLSEKCLLMLHLDMYLSKSGFSRFLAILLVIFGF